MANLTTHYISKGLQNQNDSALMTWWQTNFNMPVPYLFTGSPTWTEYRGPLSTLSPNTSFSLSSFFPGFEAVAFLCNFHWDGPLSGTATLNTQWINPSGGVAVQGMNGQSVNLSIGAGNWYEYIGVINIGAAGWEINTNGNFKTRSWSFGTGAIGLMDTTIAFSNVPDPTQLGGNKPGFIWIEGVGLAYICANQWKHKIAGVDEGNVGTQYAGAMWLGTDDLIHWIGTDGHKYKIPWAIKQFTSTFSNGAPGPTYAGTGQKGIIWVDNQFGWTHLAFIASDGYKYLCGAGKYPYTAP